MKYFVARALGLALVVPVAEGQAPFQHRTVDPSAANDMHVKAAGDMNGDGFMDLLVGATGGSFFWYEERSAHPEWTRHTITTPSAGLGEWSTEAECGDLDGDGDVDVFVSDGYKSLRVGWFENLDGVGGSFAYHPIGAPWAHDIELADLDDDGDLDAVTRRQGSAGDRFEVWLNDGSASSWTHETINAASLPQGEGLALGDLDDDGDPDVVTARYWYENTGDMAGGWVEYEYSPTTTHGATFVALGDIDGDGNVDVFSTPSESAGGSGDTAWHRAPADPKTGPWVTTTVQQGVETVTHTIGVGDLDLDGDLDLLTAEMHQGGNPDEVRVYWNDDGVGTTWVGETLSTDGSHSMRIVDVGGDGDLDLYGANHSTTQQVDLWENKLRSPLVGQPFCLEGSACPCGNAGGPGAGCANSVGMGARLLGSGSASLAADDLVLAAGPVKSNAFGLLVMADGVGQTPIADGVLCLSGQIVRFPARQATGGVLQEGPGLVAYAEGHLPPVDVTVGSTWRFQTWYRDAAGPCGAGSSFSAGLSVTFEP